LSERITGTVKTFDISKGYGYIETSLGEDVFVYYQSLVGNGFKKLLVGDRVEFTVTRKPSGPVAVEVTRI
jgi:CspA family cold shock protein